MSSLPVRWLSLFRHGAIARTRKGACTVISRSFPRWVDIVAWPVQLRFAYREKFQKLFKDRGEIRSNLGTRLALPASKSNSEIAYISYKNLRYTFDKSAKKSDGRVLVPSPHIKACNFLRFVKYFILKLFTLRCTGQASRSMNEENCFM